MKRLFNRRLTALSVVFILLAFALVSVSPVRHSRAAAPTYTITDLGTAGIISKAHSVNGCGSVAGESGGKPAFWKKQGAPMVRTDINVPNAVGGSASALNGPEFVVGFGSTASEVQNAFAWHDNNGNGVAEAGEFATLNIPGIAFDINDALQIVGVEDTSVGGSIGDAAFVWDPVNHTQLLSASNGITPLRAFGIDNNGHITGFGQRVSDYRPFLRKGGSLIDLGSLGGNFGVGLEVEEISGVDNVVGYSNLALGGASSNYHAFLWRDDNNSGVTDPGELRDLGSITGITNSIAYDINATGDVVGTAYPAPTDVITVSSAFLWQDDNHNGASDVGEMKDLNVLAADASWVLQEARSVNDSGQIVGFGIHSTDPGNVHAFLLTPTGVVPPACSTLATTISAVSGSGAYNSTATLTATLSSLGTPVSGKTISFSLNSTPVGSAVTDSNGVATLNGVSLAGINAGSYPNAVAASFAGDSNFTSSNNTGTLTVSQAGSTTTVTVSNAAYDGSPHGGTAAVTGTGGLNQSLTVTYTGISGTTYGPSTTAPTDAGNYSASATFAGDTNHTGSSDSKNFQITQASSTTTVTVSNAAYDGSPHGGTAVVTGTGGLNQSLTVTYTGISGTTYGPSTTAPTDAGSYSAAANFAGDTNHTGSSDSKNFQITQASSATVVTVSNAAYDGSPHGGTASVTGAGGLNQSLTVTYTGISGTTYGPSTTAPTDAGSYSAAANFAGDTNHTGSSDSKTFQITQVSSTTTVTVSNAAYDGSPHGGTAVVTGAGALNQSLTITYTGISGTTYGPSTTAPTNAGSYSAAATFGGDVNHTGSSDSKNFQITQVSSTTTVTISNAAYDGSPHGGTASVTGAGGLNQSLTVTYTGISGTTYGPSNTAPTNAGNYSASATFAGDTNHTGSSDSKNFQITQASSATVVTVSNATYDGSSHGGTAAVTGAGGLNQSLTVTYTGISGTTYGPSNTAPTNAGNYSASATFAGDTNHTGSSDSKNFTINKASSTTAVSSSVNPSTFGQSVTFTATVTSSAGTATGTVQFKDGGTNLGSPAALNGSGVATLSTSSLAVGTHAITADYSGDTNFNTSTGTLAGGQIVGGSIQFTQSAYTVAEGTDFLAINVTRTGNVSGPATVKYATSDATDVNFVCNPSTAGQITGAASRKCDYHIAVGRLRFAAGESTKTIILSIVNDVYVEGSETLTITLSDPTGAVLGSPNPATVTITDNDTPGQANPIDGTAFYVRMLYVDLLSREPDPAGNAGWIHRIDFCGQPGEPPPPCDRVTVGGDGFLRSAEFFDREFFVIRLYRTALGRILRYDDVGDLAYVSGFLTDADLELNKQDVVAEIMSRPEFSGIYNSLGNAQYVDTMISTAAVTLPPGVRDGWVNALNGSTKSRAQVFRELSERPEVSAKYLHEAQVVSCYYGFFTRNPDGAYFTFLQRYDNGEITLGDLANAFINAAEYRQRFGP